MALDSKAAEAKKIDEDQHVTKPGKDLWEDWSAASVHHFDYSGWLSFSFPDLTTNLSIFQDCFIVVLLSPRTKDKDTHMQYSI